MYIEFTRDIINPYNPTELLYRAGDRKDLARSTCQDYLEKNVAVPCRRPNYGTPEWIAERLAHTESLKPEPIAAIEWGCEGGSTSQFRQNVIIRKDTRTGTTTWHSAPPADCPEAIKRHFAALPSPDPNASLIELEKNQRAQAEQLEKEKHYRRWSIPHA